MMNFLSHQLPRWGLGVAVAATALVTMTGCSGIRVVHTNRDGGEIALLGDREDAMEKAQSEMAAHCGGHKAFEIVEQGEVVVGQRTTSSQRTSSRGKSRRGRYRSRSTSFGSSTTRDVREWRVTYACVDDGGEQTAQTHSLVVRF